MMKEVLVRSAHDETVQGFDNSEVDVNDNQSLAADAEVNKLPSLRASGLVRELREASMLSAAQ